MLEVILGSSTFYFDYFNHMSNPQTVASQRIHILLVHLCHPVIISTVYTPSLLYLSVDVFTILIDPGMKLLFHWLGCYNRDTTKYYLHYLLPWLYQGRNIYRKCNEHLEPHSMTCFHGEMWLKLLLSHDFKLNLISSLLVIFSPCWDKIPETCS